MPVPSIPPRLVRAAPASYRRALLLCAPAAFLLLAGCGRSEAPLQPVYRLLDELQPRAEKERDYCEIADEFRPALGCLPVVAAGQRTFTRPQGRALAVPIKIPAALAGGMIVVEPRMRGVREEWRSTATMLLPRPTSAETELMLTIPEQVKGDRIDVQIFGRPVPRNQQEHATKFLKIGRGARLSVGLGLDPLGKKIGGAAVEFRLTAETADGSSDLVRSVLDPRSAKGWEDHDVDLAAFAGQRVRFHLATSVVSNGGETSEQAFGFPLWGAVQVLEPRSRDGRRNVILVSLDTMRGDQLGGSLSGLPLMPELTARATGGAVFENAFTTYPSTTAGHMTMLTGLYPATHGMVFATGILPTHVTTLSQVFARNGYSTAAVTEDAMLTAQVGFVRGFDYFREFKGKTQWQTAGEIEQTFGAGLRWIEGHPDERFFLFLHTYQVHTPYEPPAEYDVFTTYDKDGHEVPIDAAAPRAVVDRHHYAGEVRYSDAVLNQLLTRLDELGVLDDTIVAVTGDHGDEFGEHGQIGHAKTAYDEVLHVPLVLLGPHVVPAGKRIDVPVSLIDLAPTLLDLVHLPIPPEMEGLSLVPLLRDEPFPAMRVLYAEAPHWGAAGHRIAARTARFKWIDSDNPGTPIEIYDLARDPGEKTKLDDARLVAQGKALVNAYRALGNTDKDAAASAVDAGPAKKPELDEQTIEKLRRLGYID